MIRSKMNKRAWRHHFPIIRTSNSKMSGLIWPKIILYRAFMPVLVIRFTTSAFHKLLSVYVFSYFPFGFEGRMWDLIVSVPDHCLSFYFGLKATKKRWRHHFPHYKSMGAFCCHGHQSFDPICLKTLCSLLPLPVMLHIKFDQDWPTGLRDI